MADWDTADLVARCNRDARIPSTATFPVTADWYAWLTRAEAHWKPKLAAEYPYPMYGAPTLMTTADNIVYTFGTDAAPLAVEVYAALVGPRLIAGQFADSEADYVWEGSQIRITNNTVRSFPNGPYARWVASPGGIDGSNASTIKPPFARQLLVDRALIYWARAAERDPARFQQQELETWAWVQEAVKQQNVTYGDAANTQRMRVSGLAYLTARQWR